MSEESIWHGQARQDEFVAAVLSGKHGGTFVDLGAGHPIHGSNTYAIEQHMGWYGILSDIEHAPAYASARSKRNVVIADAFDDQMKDKIESLSQLQAGRIDYLSLDIEPPTDTLGLLIGIPFDTVRFSVITCEHDYYRMPSTIKYAMAGVLQSNGYVRVAEDVQMIAEGEGEKLFSVPVEDWWVDPNVINVRQARALAKGICHKVEAAIVIAIAGRA